MRLPRNATIAFLGFVAFAGLVGFLAPANPVRVLSLLVLLGVTAASVLAPTLAFSIVLFMLPFFPTLPDFSLFGLPRSLNFQRWCDVVLALSIAAHIAKHGANKLRPALADLVYLSGFALCLITSVVHSGQSGILLFVSAYSVPIMIYVSARVFQEDWRHLSGLLTPLLLGGFVTAATIIYEAVFVGEAVFIPPGAHYEWGATRFSLFRPGGILGSAPLAAWILTSCFLLAAVFSWFEKERVRRVVYTLAATLLAIALVLTFTRSAWLGALLALLVIARFVLKARRTLVMFAVSVLAVIVLGHETLSTSFVVERGVLRPETASTRLRLIGLSITELQSSRNLLFGSGIEGLYRDPQLVSTQLAASGTHNFYLQLLLEQGVVGFVLFMMWLYLVLRDGFRRVAVSEEFGGRREALALLTPIVALAVALVFTHMHDFRVLALLAFFGSSLVNRNRVFGASYVVEDRLPAGTVA